MNLSVTRMVRDEGSIVVFAGTDDEGREVHFGCDHGPAQEVVERIIERGTVQVAIDSWQIVGVMAPGIGIEAAVAEFAAELAELPTYDRGRS